LTDKGGRGGVCTLPFLADIICEQHISRTAPAAHGLLYIIYNWYSMFELFTNVGA
jgi:hypothetical protein